MIPDAVISTDVLVIGGGMAAAWAAIAAAEAGANVIVVDKGAMGTSGVTAQGGPGHWWVPPDPGRREAAVAAQTAKAQGLADPEWMERVLDLTWRHLPDIAPYYPFGSDGQGGRYVQGVRGPEYMRALRALVLARGVPVLDHHPAVELIADEDGQVRGARGIALASAIVWEIRADATIIATGGCAFRSGLIGSRLNTGDGLLMAAEAGAELSGMEFSTQYSLSPAWASTRTLPYFAARFFDATGDEIIVRPPDAGHAHLQDLAQAMLAGTVYADLSEAPRQLPGLLHRIQPLTQAAFARRGIDPFRERFPVRLYAEGTIRGTGGLRLTDRDCRTGVPGLFAAGDAATRELVAGASSGGGAVNSAWALASGRIAGQAAAAAAGGDRAWCSGHLQGLGRAGLHPRRAARSLALPELAGIIGQEMNGYRPGLWRSAPSLSASRDRLELAWREIADHGYAEGRGLVELRSVAAMAATARWCTLAALTRSESRGLHRREDRPATEPAQGHRLIVGGLEHVWLAPERAEAAFA